MNNKDVNAGGPSAPPNDNWLTPEEAQEISDDINSGRWPYLMPPKPSEKQEINAIVDQYFKGKARDRVKVTYDENGNRYIHVDGEWIG